MKLEVHVLSHDDEQMLPWALRHWAALGADVVVHDGGPKGTNRPSGSAVYLPWDTGGQLNDELARKLKNECWRGTDADFVAVVDADELLWFPAGVRQTLETHHRNGAAVLKTHGFEMFSEEWWGTDMLDGHPATLITDIVKDGAPEDEWYSKPSVFSPRLVHDSGFGIGAHESRPVLKDGRVLNVDREWPRANPPIHLLHFKSIFGGIERIAARYDATRARLAAVNVRHNWGNVHDSGRVHAEKKRAKLLPLVRRVLP